MIGFGSLVMIASIGAYVLFQAGLYELNRSVTQSDLLQGSGTKAQVSGDEVKGAFNILMVGLDASKVRTDSIIIAHVPASHQSVYLISLPRDTRVNLPGGGTSKINSAFDNGGFKRLQQTISLNYGISVNAAMSIDFDGFKDIVDKVGGVDMDVDETTYSIHHGYKNNDKSQHAAPYKINPQSGVPICSNPHLTFDKNPDQCTLPGVKEMVYPKGPYHFDSYDALDFVRSRDGLVGTDYARQRHQQQFLKALMKKAYSQGMSNPVKLVGLISSLKKAFTFDGIGVSLDDWLFTLKAVGPSSLITIKTNDGQYVAATGPPDGAGAEQALNADSQLLLKDVRDDKGSEDLVGTFLQSHTDWASTS